MNSEAGRKAGMAPPWSERQRLALRTLRHAIAVRAEREQQIAVALAERSRAIEEEFQQARQLAEEALTAALAHARAQAEGAVQQVETQYASERAQAEKDRDRAKQTALFEYEAAKEALEAEFEEARWTINTIYEADKKVAREQLGDARTNCTKSVELVEGRYQEAQQLWERWHFIEEPAEVEPVGDLSKTPNPWQALDECLLESESALAALQGLKAPRYLNGSLPWILLGLVWFLLSSPAPLFEAWYYWLLGVTVVVVPAGMLLIVQARKRARARVAALGQALGAAAQRARALKPVCLEQARLSYEARREENKERQKTSLHQSTQDTRDRLLALRQQRDEQLTTAKESARQAISRLKEERQARAREIEETYRRQQAEAQAQHDQALQEAGQRYQMAREENNRRHAQEWTDMLRHWKQGGDQFVQTYRTVTKESSAAFPPWSEPWRPVQELPWGLRLGELRLALEDFPQGIPEDSQLPRHDFSGLGFPALLPFPEKASLLFKANDAGKAEAVRALQALLLRCWTALPPGKVRATIIDPVGRGENFAAFMHLADHDENLIHGRIWTEPAQIEQRLSDLTGHVENVLQKYLRNQYQTLAEYNEQAGEVAEPFRFLVVADFPVNFTTDAARRLISLASAGARCGVYTFVMIDTKQPLPHGIERADLERVCTCLDWREDHFIWEDEDFTAFPLSLDAPPPPERCTELLDQVGQEAKRVSRVEVPFEWIAPPREAWWTSDSRQGIAVALGRAGARSRQQLQLGQGTSQHALIAGKTGSGKSTLLHVLITQLALYYSPREVELYLIDFKKGVEFKSYAVHALPHARVVAVESEREFGLSVLQRLDAELSRRGELFRAHGVSDLASYRQLGDEGANGAPANLPRVLLIVDEFQEFFVEDDRLAQEAALLLDRLVRQGRAFGVHVLLGSQTLGGAYSLARSTIDQMAVRIALQCSEADAQLILSRDNPEARLLSRPGEAIYNAAHGLLEGNHLFQIVWLADARRDELLREVHELARQQDEARTPIVFEGTATVELSQNQLLQRCLAEAPRTAPPWHAWLGEPVAIKDPTAATFRKQSGSNLLLVGQQEETALGLTAAALVSLAAQTDPKAPLHLVAASTPDDAEPILAALTETLPLRRSQPRELPALLDQLTEELNRRLQGGPATAPIFLCLHGLHRLRDLRRPDDDFGFSRREEKPSPYRQLVQLLKDGPLVGLFTLLWCDTYTNLQRSFDRPTLREFDQRVLLQMSATDSSSLIDSPLAAKLGTQRALFHAEDQGRLEKFRPYAVPSVEWLRDIPNRATSDLPASETPDSWSHSSRE